MDKLGLKNFYIFTFQFSVEIPHCQQWICDEYNGESVSTTNQFALHQIDGNNENTYLNPKNDGGREERGKLINCKVKMM